MWGERWLSRLYFGTGLYRLGTARRRPPPRTTREERLRAVYGPSRRLLAVVVLLWLLTLAALVHLVALLRGLIHP